MAQVGDLHSIFQPNQEEEKKESKKKKKNRNENRHTTGRIMILYYELG